jgi:hypothetical protein
MKWGCTTSKPRSPRLQLDGRPETLGLDAHPELADLVGGQFALPPGRVELALEGVERDLADHRVDHVLDLGRQQRPPFGLGLRLGEQRLERQHLAEHRSRLGQRQRRRRHQRALAGGEHLVHAMAEFMGKRHHVARAPM